MEAGRLHLTAVVRLKPYLTDENAPELLALAEGRSKSELEQLLAERFPKADLPARVELLSAPVVLPLADAGEVVPEPLAARDGQVVPEPPQPVSRPKVTPLSPRRFGLQVTIDQETHDKLEYAKALLSHQLPSGDLARVLDRALDALIAQLEKQKFGAGRTRTRRRPRTSTNPRHIPAQVKHAVWQRDQGRCTFTTDTGERCPANELLELDHIEPVARGGESTVQNLRLRCRAHNQYEAERAFGREFMQQKREQAQRAAAERARAKAAAEDVVPYLESLGFRTRDAKRLAEVCETMPDATLEERVRAALQASARKPSRPVLNTSAGARASACGGP